MAHVKADRQTFIDLQNQFIKLTQQLEQSLVDTDQCLDDTYKDLEDEIDYARRRFEDAEENLRRCRQSVSPSCYREEEEYHEADRRLNELLYARQNFDAQVDSYRKFANIAWDLVNKELPESRIQMELREKIVDLLRSKLGILNENSGQSVSTNSDKKSKGGNLRKAATSSLFAGVAVVGGFTNSAPSDTPQESLQQTVKPAQQMDNLKRRNTINYVNRQGQIEQRTLLDVTHLPDPDIAVSDFHKVSSEDMRAGLAKLQTIIERVNEGTENSGEYWSKFDSDNNLSYEHGYRKIFDAFFGDSSIRVEYHNNQYNIINGRHRIWLAKKMGITKLPLMLIDHSD
jgi:hypothetical protein